MKDFNIKNIRNILKQEMRWHRKNRKANGISVEQGKWFINGILQALIVIETFNKAVKETKPTSDKNGET